MDKFKIGSIETHKRAQKSALLRFGSNLIMMELVSGAIYVTVQKNHNEPFQGFKIIPKRTLKKMFDRFKAEYAQIDKFLQFFFLNSRILESETAEQVGMEEGSHIECFNFLNFFLGGDLAEMDGCHISLHFALRTVDTGLLDVAVRVLRADGTIVEVVGDHDVRNMQEFLQFMVRPIMKRFLYGDQGADVY
jgi:hypothetical protein